MSRTNATCGVLTPVIVLMLTGGCTVTPSPERWPESRALAREYSADRTIREDKPGSAFAEPVGRLTLSDALRLALVHHPSLTSAAWEVRTRDGLAEQAGLFPNPEVVLEVENFGGSGDAGGFDGAETTISIAQVIPGANRIDLAVRVGELDRMLAGWDYEAARIRVASMTAQRFTNVLVAQRRIDVAERNLALAEQVADIAARRVEAGDVPPSELARARVTAFGARIDVKRAESRLDAARMALVAQWGGMQPRFDRAAGDLELLAAVPALDALMGLVDEHPDVARWASETARRRAQLALAEALSKPDFTLEGGFRYLGESDDVAFVAAIGLPLTINDRNQGGVRAAEASLVKAAHERRIAEIGLRLALTDAHQVLRAAFDEAESLRDDVLPAARSVFEAANRAYEQGQIGWLEEIDAQRTLMELQSQYLDALATYHLAAVQIEGLIGRPLSQLEPRETNPTPEPIETDS